MLFFNLFCLLSAKHNQVQHDLCPPNPDFLAQGISTVLISTKLLDVEALMNLFQKIKV